MCTVCDEERVQDNVTFVELCFFGIRLRAHVKISNAVETFREPVGLIYSGIGPTAFTGVVLVRIETTFHRYPSVTITKVSRNT